MKNNIYKVFGQKNKKFWVWGYVLTVLGVVFMLELAQITQLFIDSVYTTNGARPLGVVWGWVIGLFNTTSSFTVVLVLGVLFVVVALFKNICTFSASQCFYMGASRSRSSLRRTCFKKLSLSDNLPSAKQSFFNMTSDCSDFGEALYVHRPKMFENAVKVVLAGMLCLIIDWRIAIGFIAVVPVILLVGFMLEKKLVRLFSEARNRKSDMFGVSEEMIENIKDIKTFGGEAWAINKYSSLNHKQTKAITSSYNLINKHQIPLNILKMAGIVLAFALSALACFLNQLTVGYMVLIMAYAVIIFESAVMFVTSYYDYRASTISVQRLAKFLGGASSIKNKTLSLNKKFDIEFKDVGFTDNSTTKLNHQSFTVPFGSHTAIVSTHDTARTAILRLLMRFMPVSSGQILLNNIAQEEYNISSLRQGFSIVSQEPAIFEGTILDNITMFEKADPHKLENAVKVAGLDETLEKLSGKEEHFLVESGKNLPVQDRQKIAIARAVYRNSPVLVLNSAFNKFSTAEAKKLIKNLREFYSGRTVILLTENLSLAKLFDNQITLKSEVQK